MDHEQTNPSSPSLKAVCQDFENRWRSGERPRIEDCLCHQPEQRSALLHELVLLEWSLREADGQNPTISEYCLRFPQDDLPLGKGHVHQPASAINRSEELEETRKSENDQAWSSKGDELPRQIGRYKVIRLLGRGGFGKVILASDDRLRRDVAIKLPGTKLREGSADVEQYLSEARTLAELDHPHIVPVYDVGSTDAHPCFVVSKWIEGIDLAEKLGQSGPLPHRQSVELIVTVAEALQFAHAKKIVHRDIKPANVLLDTAGKPYLADFGLALREQDYGRQSGISGTIAYMSPEQARGEGHLVDGRSDIFSLGIVFYELLTGERPFVGDDRIDVLRRITTLDVRPPRQLDRHIPRELQRICLKALAKRASDRYPTADDLVEDLRHWLSQEAEDTSPSSGSTARTVTPHMDAPPLSSSSFGFVVPKGLRCFDQRDADFFLSLVPGARDRNGLPDTIRQWKAWVEESAADDTQRVGVIYGPSGCGKSSWVRAGLLPQLENAVLPLIIEAAPQRTEDRLLKQLHDVFPRIPDERTLADSLADIRQGAFGRSSVKVLIVLDQFEQWLQAHGAEEQAELVTALRQCDGVRLQCMLLVRDDFFLALNRFMAFLDIPVVQGKNMMLVDLFDPLHAHKVLLMFGQAYERLPPETNNLSDDQQLFLSESVESLQSDGRVFPVRLALFTEMVKGRPWTASTVRELGGAEGIGTLFLEEAFSSQHAPAAQRIHEAAALSVLESLLPAPGTKLRGQRRTRGELLEASGYDRNRFDELLNVLDTQLRLVTATEPDGSGRGTSDGQPLFQLSHDYLVSSVRQWIARQRALTFRGRIRQQLSDHASVWSARPDKRMLPSWTEWITYRVLLPTAKHSKKERLMLRAATRRHTARTAAVVAALLIATFGVYFVLRLQQARSLTHTLFAAEMSKLPPLLEQITPYRHHVQEPLRRVASQSEDVREKLVSYLALARWDTDALDNLCSIALESEDPNALLLVRDAFVSADAEIADRLWQVLESDEEASRRMRAAQLLASLRPPADSLTAERWKQQAGFLQEQLVETCIVAPQSFDPLTNLLHPMASVMIESLAEAVGGAERSAEAVTQVNLLLRFLQHSPRELTKHCLAASTWQLDTMLPLMKEAAAETPEVAADLHEVISQLPTAEQSPEDRQRVARRVATAAALLAYDGHLPSTWDLLRRRPVPTTRAYLVRRLQQVGVPLSLLAERLVNEQDPGIRTALLQTIGEYDDAAKPPDVLALVRRLYQTDPDAGVHSAAEWLLRKWDESWLATSSLPEEPPNETQWRVNSAGHVMIRLDGRNDPRIGRVYEISSKEVSLGQFLRFRQTGDWRRKFIPSDKHPAGAIDWFDAIAYCNYISEQEAEFEPCYPFSLQEIEQRTAVENWTWDETHLARSGYRLPTEAEWEMACQAGAVTRCYFGDQADLVPAYAWVAAQDTQMRSQPCGLLKPNDFGLFDMLGNVQEWCDDVGEAQSMRVLRGGNYRAFPWNLVKNQRASAQMAIKFNSIGLRVARTIEMSDGRAVNTEP